MFPPDFSSHNACFSLCSVNSFPSCVFCLNITFSVKSSGLLNQSYVPGHHCTYYPRCGYKIACQTLLWTLSSYKTRDKLLITVSRLQECFWYVGSKFLTLERHRRERSIELRDNERYLFITKHVVLWINSPLFYSQSSRNVGGFRVHTKWK